MSPQRPAAKGAVGKADEMELVGVLMFWTTVR